MAEHIKSEWRGNWSCCGKPDGSYIDRDGSICYIKNGMRHREDGPAAEYAKGSKLWHKGSRFDREGGPEEEMEDGGRHWYINGKEHREDGPAIEYDGGKEWFINGKRHRKGGPAIERADGHKEWYKNDKLHREDGPAVEYADGRKEWWVNGVRHREDGPAIERANGTKEWYIKGNKYSEENYNKKMNKLKLQTELETGSEKQMTEHVKAEWFRNEHNLSDGSYINSFDNVGYIKNGMLHREDGPAEEFANGCVKYYLHGICLNGKDHHSDVLRRSKEHKQVEWETKERELSDGSYIDKTGLICHIKNGRIHRDCGPAVYSIVSGLKEWYINGKLHRIAGPAIIEADGIEKHYINGIYCELDGVDNKVDEFINSGRIVSERAFDNTHKLTTSRHIYSNMLSNLDDGSYTDRRGLIYYVKNGMIHREGGPAIERNGDKEWCINGRLHREDGPAIEYANGDKKWWVDGERHREDGPAIEWHNGRKEWYLNDKRYSEEEYNKKMNKLKPQTKPQKKSQTETESEKQVDNKVKSLTYGEIIDSAAIRSGVDLYSNGIRSAVKHSLNSKVDDKLIDNDVFNSIVLLASSSVIDSFDFSNSVIESIKEECTIAGIAKSIEFTIDNISTIASNMSGPIEKLLGKDDIKELRIFGEKVGVATTEFEEAKSEDSLKQSK